MGQALRAAADEQDAERWEESEPPESGWPILLGTKGEHEADVERSF